MEIYFDNNTETELPRVLTDKIREVLLLGIFRAGKSEAELELGVSFVTPEEIRGLNREYRRIDAVTDVLSFGGGMDLQKIKLGIPVILGDIVICIERAKAQAEEYGHSFERETAFLAAHGLLHLLGYDHENEDDEKKMTAEQEAILGALGISR